MPTPDELLRAEAVRLHERYTVEVIERFNLCPWARKARADGDVERHVLLQRNMDLQPTLDLLAALEAAPRPVAIAIAIYPRLRVSPREFDAFAAALKAADQQRAAGGRPAYVSATFHPDYPFSERSAAALVPWLRRSPDPSLQLARFDVIEAARGPSGKMVFDYSEAAWAELSRRLAKGSVQERVAAENFATAKSDGDELERVVAGLHAARRARDAALDEEDPG